MHAWTASISRKPCETRPLQIIGQEYRILKDEFSRCVLPCGLVTSCSWAGNLAEYFDVYTPPVSVSFPSYAILLAHSLIFRKYWTKVNPRVEYKEGAWTYQCAFAHRLDYLILFELILTSRITGLGTLALDCTGKS